MQHNQTETNCNMKTFVSWIYGPGTCCIVESQSVGKGNWDLCINCWMETNCFTEKNAYLLDLWGLHCAVFLKTTLSSVSSGLHVSCWEEISHALTKNKHASYEFIGLALCCSTGKLTMEMCAIAKSTHCFPIVHKNESKQWHFSYLYCFTTWF